MFKRIMLFAMTNILIMVMLGVIISVTGIGRYIDSSFNINFGMLFIFSAVIGFTGSFISLALSKFMAKFSMGVKVINPKKIQNDEESWLINTVYTLAAQAGMKKMPEVGIYESNEVNAFATGATKNSSLVAVSSGMLYRMDKDSIEGVLGHEIAHITNGDMVTMTLLQGVINTFVEFFSRIIGWAAARFMAKDDEEPSTMVYFIVYIVMQITLGLLGTIAVMSFSRYREFKADKGGADIAGREKMISALKSLQNLYQPVDERGATLATMKIGGKKSFFKLFSTHPDLEERIKRLENGI